MLSQARFILSRSKAIEKYDELKGHADIISYSYKTNFDVGHVLEKETDSMFSIHTMKSLEEIRDRKRVWFFAQAWDDSELDLLTGMGVDKFVVDNENDLSTLLGYLGRRKIKASLLLRMRLKEHTIHTGKHYVYGMYSSRVNELLPELRGNKNIDKLGIHFHRKTQNVSEWSLKEELSDTIREENWKNIDYVNIGGGVPAEYKNSRSSVFGNIFGKIAELRSWLNSMGIKMIMEPGRYIASYPVKLEASIINIYDGNIVIDCSVYNAAMDTFVANVRLLIEGEIEDGDGESYTIKGCTPDSMDIFRYKVLLPKKKVGDKIVFLNAGAYTYSTDFCNLPKLKTVITD